MLFKNYANSFYVNNHYHKTFVPNNIIRNNNYAEFRYAGVNNDNIYFMLVISKPMKVSSYFFY